MNERVLIVDDEGSTRLVLRRLFESRGDAAQSAASAREALEMIDAARPDAIVADILMPDMDGVSLLKRLRERAETSDIPSILITGANLPSGLLETADDSLAVGEVYLKGGDFVSLVDRVESLLRDGAPRERVVISPLKRAIWIDGNRLPALPARRFQLLCVLLRSGKRVSREELLVLLWDGKDNLNVVDVTILRLRQDLADVPFLRIDTASGGYAAVLSPYNL